MFVSAGDLEKYSYCPLSWWLSKEHKKVYSEGIEFHRNVEEELKEIKEKETKTRIYEKYILFLSVSSSLVAITGIAFLYSGLEKFWTYFFIIMALLWLLNSSFFLYRINKVSSFLKPKYERLLLISSIGAIIIAFFAIIFNYPANEDIGRFAEILALIWVAIANILFYRVVYISDIIAEKKIKYMPLKGEIEYIGANREGEEIISEKYGIKGKPDYVLKIDDDYIPVEEKSADFTSPKYPHVIQITAYCMLIEDKYGKAPPYGILKYKNSEFKIPYEKRWKNRILKMRESIIEDIKRGEAHRNHYNPKKCKNCLRRDYCNERIA
ncbi:MAG TPA: Dna2/Cas4 domain-containing protein [Thermoplasmatales archaeon]|nr:Dna2/Cas4 domain-containing protein [Thermoplasmatales archaeon]